MTPVREVLLLCWRDSSHPQGGGSERYLERVAAELASRGIRVTLRTARHPGAARSERRDGFTISRGGGRYTVYPRALAAVVASRFGHGSLAGVRPDVIVDTQNGIPFFVRWASRAPEVVLVHHCHRDQWPVAGRITGAIGWAIESRVAPWVYRRNQYLTVSMPSREDLIDLGVSADRIAVVRGGIDPVPDAAVEGEPELARLCVLSRLVPHKQIEHALAAVAALAPTHPGLVLDIIGDGWWHDELVKRATELGVLDRVVFHGRVDEAAKFQILGRATTLLMPSRTEGWGLAVIEAAQMGVPTIGYRSSRGLTDSIVDGVTGLLVGDEGELVLATGELLADPARARRLGAAARQRAAGYSWSATAQGVLTVASEVVDGRRVSGLVDDEQPLGIVQRRRVR